MRLEITQSINEKIKVCTAHNLVVADSRQEFFRTGAGANVVNFANHSLFLRNLSLTSTTGNFKLPELLIPDWQNPLAGLRADASGTFDLSRLSGLLRGAAVGSTKVDLAGTGQLAMKIAATGAGGRELTGELRLADAGLVREKKTIPVSKELRLTARLVRQDPEGAVDIKELRLESDPLLVEGTGVISRGERWRKIELQGRMTPKLEQLSTVLRDGFGCDLRLAGGQSEPFLAQYPLDGGDGTGASLVTSLHADRLDYQGNEVRSLHMPFSLENGKLHLEATGQLNAGKLVLIADSDLAGSGVITMPANSQILTGVQVRQPLADTLLSSLHPLFGPLARPSGQLDLRVDSLSWPLAADKKDAASLETVADLRDITLESSKTLQDILLLFGLEKEKIALGVSELTCSGRQGRITCTPLKLRVGEAEMAVSGSTGLDGTLDYLLELPVTRKLVSEEGYRLLQGATVRVPLRGTLRAPVFDRARTTAAVRDLRRQAASSLQAEKTKQRAAAGTRNKAQGKKE